MHGDTCEALRDLTGGVAEKLQWQQLAGGGAATAAASGSAPVPAQSAATAVAGSKSGPGRSRPRVAGWGVAAGTTPPPGWIFEEVRDRLSDGQVIGCR